MGKKDDAVVPTVGKKLFGFAKLVQTPEGQARVRELAGIAGRAAHKSGRAHVWTTEEAREAGRRGGVASQAAWRARKAAKAAEGQS